MRQRAWIVLAGLGVLAGAGFLVVATPALRELIWIGVLLASCSGIVLGVRWHRPVRRYPWWILLAALVVLLAANVINYPVWAGPAARSFADQLSLLAFPMIGVGALSLTRLQTPGGDRESAIDGSIVMIAMATVLAGTVYRPDGIADDVSWAGQLLNTVVAPLMMAAVTAATFRLLFVGSARVTSAWLVVVAAAASMAGNVARALQVADGNYVRGSWPDLFILGAYISIALAALHPSSSRLTEPADSASQRLTHARLIVLGVSLIAAPATLVIRDTGEGLSVPIVSSVVLSLLVLWRLSRLVVDREAAREALHQRAERQEALAELGLQAVDEPDLDDLSEAATIRTRDLLDLRTCRIGDPPDDPPEGAIVLPIADGTVLLAERDEPWNHEDRAFLQAVVNALTGAVERQATHELMRYRAVHDALTGLPNRSLILDRLEHALARQRRAGIRVAVMFIDLDGFKQVNDVYGHQVGDDLLLAVAERLGMCVRDSDTLGRLAGDEFVVICEDAPTDEVRRIADRLTTSLSQPFTLGDASVQVGASVGVVESDGATTDPEELLAQADAAMYVAKGARGSAVATYDEVMATDRVARVSLQHDLDGATERGELDLVYQPLVALRSGEDRHIVGIEALLRWHHPTLGPIPPAEFVPLAEMTGLIVPIGDWVLQQACARVARLTRDRAPEEPLTVFVNLSPRQLADPGLIDRVDRALAEAELAPCHLGVEISEVSALDVEGVAALHRLSALGVRVALDDLGAGRSSVDDITRLPLDLIKLDGALVAGAVANRSQRSIVRGACAIAHELGVEVVAEQVETREQLAMLTELGCDLAQGYLLGGPGPAGEDRWLAVTDPTMLESPDPASTGISS